MKFINDAVVLSNNNVCDKIYELVLMSSDVSNEAVAGQFIEIYTGKKDILLPRPISICEINKEIGTIKLLYNVVGKGTEVFSKLKINDFVKIMGPLGNGFSTDKKGNHVLIGGGIGVPPLLELAKNLDGEKFIFIGARTNPVLVNEFKKITPNVFVATDDGSFGFKGNVVELLRSKNIKCDNIYACGPKIMLKGVCEYAKENSLDAEISMEERMACGIGVCVGCVVKVMKNGELTNLKICKDGPVFLSSEVVFGD